MGFFGYFFLLLLIVFVSAVIVSVILVKKQPRRVSPYRGSALSLSAIIINWLLFLIDFYVLLPVGVADFLFTFVWVVLILAAGFFSLKEFRNNRAFAVFLSAITFNTAALVVVMHGIGGM